MKGCFCGMNMPSGYIPEGFSTDKLTIKFVWFVILSWYVALQYLCSQDVITCWDFAFVVIFPFGMLIIVKLMRCCNCKILDKLLYSDVRNKKREYEN